MEGEGMDRWPLELLPPEEPEPLALNRSDLPLERLRIAKDGEERTIWGVHRSGWQALGWQVLPAVAVAPVAPLPPVEPLLAGEALLSGEEPDFGGMTKAQISSFCLATYGVVLDGDQTKAQLIEQAHALLEQSDAALPPELL
jgi:hypothetical protein